MTSISAVSAATTAAATTGSSGTSSTGAVSSNDLNKDAFLKLMVAQLKYQDPTKPTDSSQFLAQTAQFTLVEKFEELATLSTELLSATQTQSATSLVGRTVSWSDGTATRTGVVSAVTIAGGVPTLMVGDQKVSLGDVTRVTASA